MRVVLARASEGHASLALRVDGLCIGPAAGSETGEAPVHNFLEFLHEMRHHWSTLALIITWVGVAVVYVKRRAAWMRKQFLNQVNFSLNYITGDTLAMRTLVENKAPDVWLNEYGVNKVFAAAGKTTVENPFIVLEDQTDQDFINRAVLNVLSEKFADAFLSAALGMPVKHASFCFAITCERYSEIRTLKLRVLIMEEKVLTNLFGPDAGAEKLKITLQVYKSRMQTLKAMYAMYMRDKGSDRKALGYMEMGIPTDAERGTPSVEVAAAE
jgi:hypothetical protein